MNNNESESGKKGFSGLSSMVSDVTEEIQTVAKTESVHNENPEEHHQTSATTEPENHAPAVQQATQPPTGSDGSKAVLWGGAIIIGIIFLIANGGSKDSPSQGSAPTYSAHAPAPVAAPMPSSVPQAKPTAKRGEKPPVGDGLVLNREQIKYCLAEDVRIDAVKQVMQNTKKSEVDNLNRLVADYNSRCGHFKYRSGTLESVQGEIALERSEIERLAKSEWVRNSLGLDKPVTGQPAKQPAKPKKTPSTEASASTTSNAMYEPPVAPTPVASEPRYQAPTSSAPKTSASSGIPANAHIASWGSDWECDKGFRKQGSGCAKVEIPVNGHLASWGSDWECDRGYRKQGNACARVEIPMNGHLASWGSDWECDKGYRKQGNGCASVDIPANAHLASWGSDWECDKGYRKQGNGCARVEIPANGHLASWGSDWECDKGYRKQGNSCSRVEVPENAQLASWGSDFVCNRGYQRSGNVCVLVGQSR